ncbi:PDI-like 1-4 [Wolffia australiana]
MASICRRSLPLLLLLLFFVASSVILSCAAASSDREKSRDSDDDDDDISFLEDFDVSLSDSHDLPPEGDEEENEYEDDASEEFDGSLFEDEDDPALPTVDEKDVVVLTDGNFSRFLEDNRNVLVEFYAPWCGHCHALAPEFAAAATELKEAGWNAVLAKVDATEENDLAQKYDIQGYPTVLFFMDGDENYKSYPGFRNKEAIVTWIKKKTGSGIQNVTTVEDAQKVLTAENKLVLAYLDSLVGDHSDVLSSASKIEDGVNFYQTASADVAKLFHIDPNAKRPALVILKKEDEKITHFEGEFKKSVIAEFVFANKLPLVTMFTMDSSSLIFDNPIKKQLLLFASSNDSEKILVAFKDAAKSFKGKIIFVYVNLDDEKSGKPVAEYFGITEGPKVLGFTGNEDGRKFFLNGDLTVENIQKFGQDFFEDKLKPFYKSEPIPEKNDGDVKIVVGNNFEEIVLDESKDVLLEIYAPWCGHCQALEPTYNRLAKHLRSINSLVVAKMDGTTNEHPRAKTDGFPTLLFFPAGNKSFDPLTVDTDRTVVAFYKFLKKHATIPFKLKKPAAPPSTEEPPAAKDEL